MPEDERDDETQAMDVDADDTQLMSPDDEPTQVVSRSDDATRRLDHPLADEVAPTRRIEAVGPATSPATERIAFQRRSTAGGWLIALIVVVALLAGGIVGYTQREPSGGKVEARALVRPEGGEIRFDGIGRLVVPANALPTATAITVRRETVDRRIRLGAEGDPRSVTYEPGELDLYVFEPSTLRFQQPVTIELPRRVDGSAVLVDTKLGPRVIAGTVDGEVIRIRTSSFTFDDASPGDGS